MNKTPLVILILASFLLNSCKQKTNKEQGINYTDYINSQELTKIIVDKYADGKEKSIIFKIKEISDQYPVKEIHFFQNGNIQVEGTLKNGKRHGIWTFYYENGQVWSKGEFNMDKSIGEFDIYDEKGQIKFKYYYEKGIAQKQEIFLKEKLYKTIDLLKTSNDTSK